LIKEDQMILTSILEKLKIKGVKQLKGKESSLDKIIQKINSLPAPPDKFDVTNPP